MTDKLRVSSVFIRKYIFQFAVFLLSFIFLTVLSLSVCEKATKSYAERQRYKTAELNEIIFSYSEGYEESLYYFSGSAHAFTVDGHSLSADIFMTDSAKEYKDNPLYLKSSLSEGTTAVSENLAFRFGLKIGDTVTVLAGKDKIPFGFIISEILPAQSGIDDKYMHDGIIVLAESKAFLEMGENIYVSFAKDWGAEFVNLTNDTARSTPVIYTKDTVKSAENKLLIYACLSTLSLWIFICLCEIFIFSKMGKKYRDYSILSCYGISKRRLFGKVGLDNCIKYLLPLLMSFLIWLIKLRYYRAAYLKPALTFLGIGAFTALALTFITVMRKNRCPKIRR